MRGRKPDPNIDNMRFLVFLLRKYGVSRRLVHKIMYAVFGIERKDESSFNRMYREAQRKIARDPDWLLKVITRVRKKPWSRPLTPEEAGWLGGFIGSIVLNALWHSRAPGKPALAPFVKDMLPFIPKVKKLPHPVRLRALPRNVN